MIRLLYNKRSTLFIENVHKENENLNLDQFFRVKFDAKMMLNPLMFIILTFIDDNLKSTKMLKAILKYNPRINSGILGLGLFPILIAAKLKVEGLKVMQILAEFSKDQYDEENTLDVNVFDTEGNTALHYACINNNAPLVKFLVDDLDADSTILNYNNEKAIDVCKSKSDCYKFLATKTQKSQKKDIKRKTSRQFLIFKGKK
jgi:ankyrin repeat protein